MSTAGEVAAKDDEQPVIDHAFEGAHRGEGIDRVDRARVYADQHVVVAELG